MPKKTNVVMGVKKRNKSVVKRSLAVTLAEQEQATLLGVSLSELNSTIRDAVRAKVQGELDKKCRTDLVQAMDNWIWDDCTLDHFISRKKRMEELRCQLHGWFNANRKAFRQPTLDGSNVNSLMKHLPTCFARCVLQRMLNIDLLCGGETLDKVIADGRSLPLLKLKTANTRPKRTKRG